MPALPVLKGVSVLDLLLPQRCLVCGRGGAQLCEACRDGLGCLEPPLCARCGAPVAWPVARCRECTGRRLAFASARAAVPYDPSVRALVRRGRSAGCAVWRSTLRRSSRSGSRRRTCTPSRSCPPTRIAGSSAATTRPSVSRGASARIGASSAGRSSSAPAGVASGGAHRKSGVRTSAAPSVRPPACLRACCSSTTSTRPAPRRRPPRPPCALPGRGRSTWSRSRVLSGSDRADRSSHARLRHRQ